MDVKHLVRSGYTKVNGFTIINHLTRLRYTVLSYHFPLEDSKDIECCIAIDGGKKIPLKPHTGIRDRNSYKVEEIGKRHYKFTFDITDELILGLSNSSAK